MGMVKKRDYIKISDELLKSAVKESVSVAGVIKYLGKKQAGGTQAHYKNRINRLGLDISHFSGSGHNKGKISNKRKLNSEILMLRTGYKRQKPHLLRRALIESGIPYKCSDCGCGAEWKGNPLVLDVDHINENWLDDRIENLRFLCPNCHSQYSRNLK